MTKKSLLATATLIVGALHGQAASAQSQTTEPQQASASQDNAGFDIQEIIVTARRRAESLQNVPATITQVSGEALVARGVRTFADITQVSPSLTFGSNETAGGRKGIQISIRGVRSAGVASYLDEVTREPRTVYDQMYDIASIQVLKGPQGTLFGTNTTSGAILIERNRPTNALEGSVEGRVGNYGLYGGTAVLNLPIVDDMLALRIAGDFEKRDGYIKGPLRDYDDDSHWSVRGSVHFHPTTEFSNRFTVDHYELDAHMGANGAVAPYACAQGATAACLYAAPIGTIPAYADAINAEIANGPYRTNLTGNYPQKLNTTNVTNLSEVDFGAPLGEFAGDISFRSVLGYTHYTLSDTNDDDGFVLPLTQTTRKGRNNRYSGEFQIQGNRDSAFNWVIGTYLSKQKLFSSNNGDFFGGTFLENLISPIYTQLSSTTRQTAFYAQASLQLFQGLKATAGYRTTKTKIRAQTKNTQHGICAVPPPFPPDLDVANCLRNLSNSGRNPSYTFGLDYQVKPNLLIYAVTRRGFNSGNFNQAALLPENLFYRPEILTDYELGLKSEGDIGGVKVRGNIAGFISNYKDIQRGVILAEFGRPSNFTINAARARIKGLEGELNIRPSRALMFNIGVGYTDAKYTSFPFGPAAIDLSDNALGLAPKYTVSAAATYEFPEIDGVFQPALNLNMSYQSRVYFQDLNNFNNALSNRGAAFNSQKGYALVNGSVELRRIAGTGATLTLWSNNIFKQFYYQYLINTGPGIGWISGVPSTPRTFGAKVKVEF